MTLPSAIAAKLKELRESAPCKVAMNDPVRVNEGTLYVPFYDADGDNAPDACMPLLLMTPNGLVREVYGPSNEWLALVEQIPEWTRPKAIQKAASGRLFHALATPSVPSHCLV